jgi:simple sugar transport system permease protein
VTTSVVRRSQERLKSPLQTGPFGVPYQFIGMLPYLLTILVLAGLIGRTVAPAADGIPYEKP